MKKLPVGLTGTKWPNPTANHNQGETINKEKELKFNQIGRKALSHLKEKNGCQLSF